VRVYGIAKGARVPGRDPGQRHIRPASAAGSAVGRVRSAAMPRPMSAAGLQPEVPGEPLGKFKVTARLIAELYPQLTNARRWNFQNAIAAQHSRRLAAPAVLWDMLNEATVTVECVACDAGAAAETVQTVIRHIAEADAQIGVREIKIVKVSPAGERSRKVRFRRTDT